MFHLISKIKRQWVVALAAFAITVAITGEVYAMKLAENGKAECSIVVAKDAIAAEKTAAYELRDYLRQVTGADFAIKNESEVDSKDPQILVGPSESLKKLAVGVDWKALGYDGIVIKTVGNKLLLAGGRPRGTLYAVYTFLEQQVGCRWWTSSESYIPKKPALQIGDLNTIYTPKLRYRETYYREPLEKPEFAAKLKLNGNFYKIPARLGGHYEIIGWCHTFYNLLPPGTYFDKHPEWYSLLGGKRSTGHSQLCLTNEEARKELTKNALELIRRDPKAGIISISQNDGWGGTCECEKCKEIEKKEGSPSGPLIHFVNKVAEDIEKEFPEVWVETLAYTYTRKPPLHAKPRNNVVVRLCTYECSFTHPLDSEMNKDFRDDMKKWAAISPNLYVWDYVANFANYIFPHSNMRVIAPNIRFFEKHNTIGIFEQGDSGTSVGDFVRLRAYLIGHLLWDPSQDETKIVKEFMDGYYGPAAPYLERYLDLIHDRVQEKNTRLGVGHRDSSYLSLKDMNECMRLFKQAEKAVAGDPVIAKRVRRERMPLDQAWLLRYNELKQQAVKEKLPFEGPKNGPAAVAEFIKLGNEWDARNYSETLRFESCIPMLESLFAPPPPTNEEVAKLPKEDVIDIQQDKMNVMKQGEWTELVDDPAASDGKAALLKPHHTDWAIQYVFEDMTKTHPGKWECYAYIRCEGEASGDAFRYGVFNNPTWSELASSGANMQEARSDKYKPFFLGYYTMESGSYVWFAPNGNPGTVKGIYIDRIVFIRKK